VTASTGEPFEWTMPRIEPPTPEVQVQDSAVEVVTTNPMVAAEDKAADPMARAAVVVMANKAAMVAGTVAVAVDKEVDPLPQAAVAVAMVNNSNTKVNKVAILDSLTLSWFTR
jgi:hypothetical protein